MMARFKDFAIHTFDFCAELPKHPVAYHLQGQLIRSCTSPGANYRAALRAKSKADFINKLKIVEEELDESIYFLDLFRNAFPEISERAVLLMNEAESLLKIIVKAITTSKE